MGPDCGTAIVGGGRVKVDGARLATCIDTGSGCPDGGAQYTFGPGHVLDFVAKFTGDPFQHAGFGQSLNATAEPIALFSTSQRTATLDRASTFDPGNYRIHVRVAQAYISRGDCRRAVPHARAARRLFPNAGEPRRQLASCGTK